MLDLDNAEASYGITLLKAGNYYSATFGLELWVLNGTNVPASINSANPLAAYAELAVDGFELEGSWNGQTMSDGTFGFGEVDLPDVQPPGSDVVLALAAWTGGAANWATAVPPPGPGAG